MKVKFLDLKDLRTKKPAELDAYVSDMQKYRVELLHALQTGKEKGTHQLSLIKKTIARAHTVRVAQAKEEEK